MEQTMEQARVVIKTQRPSLKERIRSFYQQIKRRVNEPKRPDPVDKASQDSFPASDPPAWTVRPPL